MSVFITISTGATGLRVETGPKSPFTASKLAGESAVEVKSSKRREERRNVDTGRRPSVQWDDDERCTERRGSKASSRRQSVVKGSIGDPNERRSSVDRKKEVLVIRGS
jgi:hypothetical protein